MTIVSPLPISVTGVNVLRLLSADVNLITVKLDFDRSPTTPWAGLGSVDLPAIYANRNHQ